MTDPRYAASVDGLTEQELGALVRVAAQRVQDVLPKHIGFTLLLFDFGDGGGLAYISNAKRGDMVATMREFLDTQAGGTL